MRALEKLFPKRASSTGICPLERLFQFPCWLPEQGGLSAKVISIDTELIDD
jgi:hypothetical protein